MKIIENFLKVFKRWRWKIKGSALIYWEIVNPIAPAHYSYIISKGRPTLKVVVENPWHRAIRNLQIQVRLQGVSDWISKSLGEVGPRDRAVWEYALPLPHEKLHYDEERSAIFELRASYIDPIGELQEFSDTKNVRILAKDDMIWSLMIGGKEMDLSYLVASWVTPRDPAVQVLIHESAAHPDSRAIGGLIGYQKARYEYHEERQYNIPPGKYAAWKLHLKREAKLIYTLNEVQGGAGNDVNFAIFDPDRMVEFERATSTRDYYKPRIARVHSGYRGEFLVPIENDYYLTLDNTFSSISSKNIRLTISTSTPLTFAEITYYQMKAIYETIQWKGFVYVSSPISFAPGASQRVKRPSETIKLKGGNCIDASTLFASCFEALKFDTHIILLPQANHSIVAVRTWPHLESFFFLETAAVAQVPFKEALKMGESAFKKEGVDAKWIGIGEARNQGIMPLI